MYEEYLRQIHDHLGYLATWPPSEQISVGSVGVLDKQGRFHEETSLTRLGIAGKVILGDASAQIKYRSASDVSVDFKASGAAPATGSTLAVADAGFTISLARDNAILFEAVGCKHEKIEDVDDVGNQILDRVDAKVWKLAYLVITGVVRADSATVLISKGSNGKFEATISGSATAGAVSIGDAKLGLAVKHTSSLGLEIPAQTNLTPLFSAYRIKKSWWNAGCWQSARSIFDSALETASPASLLADVTEAR